MLVIRIARAGSRHVKHTWITFPNDRAICRQLLKIVTVTCTMSDSCYWTALNATWLVVISHFPCTCHRSNELIILYTKCSVPFQKFHCFCFFGKFWALFSNLAQQSGTAMSNHPIPPGSAPLLWRDNQTTLPSSLYSVKSVVLVLPTVQPKLISD